MLKAKHYDLAVIESARSIEAALRRALLQANIDARTRGLRELIGKAIHNQVISSEALPLLDEIRIARNDAVHSVKPISEQLAASITDKARQVLAMIWYPDEIRELDDNDESDA